MEAMAGRSQACNRNGLFLIPFQPAMDGCSVVMVF